MPPNPEENLVWTEIGAAPASRNPAMSDSIKATPRRDTVRSTSRSIARPSIHEKSIAPTARGIEFRGTPHVRGRNATLAPAGLSRAGPIGSVLVEDTHSNAVLVALRPRDAPFAPAGRPPRSRTPSSGAV